MSFVLPHDWSASADGGAKVGLPGHGISVVRGAAVCMARRVSNLDVEADWWTDFGTEYIKDNWNISPDAVSQV